MPSIVVIFARSGSFCILVTQALTGLPSTTTMQVPQWPSLQQTLHPVSSRFFLSTVAKEVSGSAISQRSIPLMLNNILFICFLRSSMRFPSIS